MRTAAARGLAIGALATVGLVAGPSGPSDAEPGYYEASTTFAAAAGSAGPVPEDAAIGCGGSAATALELPFAVSALPPGPIADVSVELSIDHGWAGDVGATLVAPDGSAHVLFGATGATAPDDCGDETYLDGLYTFSDDAAGDWWAAAAEAGNWDELPRGSYRTSAPGGADGGGTPTGITATFAHLAAAEGTWLLRVTDRTGDMWGNGVTWPGRVHGARLTITVGTTGPDTTISGPPSGVALTEPPSYELSSPHGAAATGYECRIDEGEWQACASPYSPVVASGTHVLEVRALDAEGNADPVPASTTFTYADTRPPETEITGGPAEGQTIYRRALYTFSSPDPDVAGYQCHLDDRVPVDCASPFEVGTPPGTHTLSVAAVDLSGNVDPVPATRTFTMDPARCDQARRQLRTAERILRKAKENGDRGAIRQAKKRVRRAERAHAAACEWPAEVPADRLTPR